MADPTLRLTYDALRIRVAEYLGIHYAGANGDQAAQLPVDAGDLDIVSRVVNDGYARFIGENEKWNFLTVPVTLTFLSGTVSGDNSRYYLPDDFYGILVSEWTYGPTGPRIGIVSRDEPTIRQLQAANSNATGVPSLAAVRAINTTASTTAQRWEALFWPTPNSAYAVTATYKRYPAALSTGTDASIAGFQHDRTVLAACLAAAELQRNDEQGPREAFYQTLLQQSLRMDKRATPRNLGDYGDKSEDHVRGGRPLSYYGVDTYNGLPLN